MQAFRNLSGSELFDSIVCRNFEEAVDSKSPTLYEASSGDEKDRMRTLLYISAAIANFLDFKNRRKNMNDQQIAETATLMMEEFPYLKMSDMKLFIRRLKCNAYGEVYDLDGQSFIGWLSKYVEEKRQALYRISQERERELKERRDKEAEEFAKTEEGKKAAKELTATQSELAKQMNANYRSPEQIKEREMHKIRLRVIQLNYHDLMKNPETYEAEVERLVQEEWKKYKAKHKTE